MAKNSETSIYIPSISEPTTHLFFFIPGNPGCINYYDAFFAHLSNALSCESSGSTGLVDRNLALVGNSLANFGPDPDKTGPFSLQEQIDFVEQRLHQWTEHVHKGEHSEGKLKVVLAGHSVGAFIGMEILRRWKERASSNTGGTGGEGESEATLHPNVQIVGFIGLWPTITYIVRSSNGQRLGWLLRMAHLALVTSMIVRLLTLIVPTAILRLVVRRATGFPSAAAQTTVSFLKHPFQVRQALHMARDEMNEITADRWQDDIWHAGPNGPTLALLFGLKDDWVQDDAREELIKTRGARKDRKGAQMEIDEEGIPHSFCIHHSREVAERASGLIRGIING